MLMDMIRFFAPLGESIGLVWFLTLLASVFLFWRRQWLGSLVTLLLAAPLHLLKIEPVPPGAAWIPSLAFVAFGLPSRALTGWALGRSLRRATPAHLALRVVARTIACAAALAYVGLAVLSQYTSWRGALSLFEQHVLLVPTPFMPW